jgi:thioredoxin 1
MARDHIMKYGIITGALLLMFCSMANGQGKDSLMYKSLAPYEFHLNYLREDKVILIDVREVFEYRRSRLKDAVNIPSSGNLEFASDTIDKDYALFMYCTNDFRSKRVASYFARQGFRKVYSLDGGIVAWRKDGNPVQRNRIRRKDLRD